MPGDERPDEEIVPRILGGERDLYGVLVDRHQEKLYRFALGMVRDPDAAADLVQDSFVKAYTSLSSCQNPDRFAAWIFRILRNRCMDHLKDVRRKEVSFDAHVVDLPGSDNPVREMERSEAAHVLDAALGTLPEPQREAFLLKHLEELSYEEMSEILGVGTSALKMRVMRAREALRATLGRRDDTVRHTDVTLSELESSV